MCMAVHSLGKFSESKFPWAGFLFSTICCKDHLKEKHLHVKNSIKENNKFNQCLWAKPWVHSCPICTLAFPMLLGISKYLRLISVFPQWFMCLKGGKKFENLTSAEGGSDKQRREFPQFISVIDKNTRKPDSQQKLIAVPSYTDSCWQMRMMIRRIDLPKMTKAYIGRKKFPWVCLQVWKTIHSSWPWVSIRLPVMIIISVIPSFP